MLEQMVSLALPLSQHISRHERNASLGVVVVVAGRKCIGGVAAPVGAVRLGSQNV